MIKHDEHEGSSSSQCVGACRLWRAVCQRPARFKRLPTEYILLRGAYSGYIHYNTSNFRTWQWVWVGSNTYVKKFGLKEEVMFCLWLSLPSALATQMYCAAQLASQHQAMYVIKWLHHRLYNWPQLYSFFLFSITFSLYLCHSFFLSFIALLALGILTPTCLLTSYL